MAWYDRRDSKDNLGWSVRFTASLDGGETFLPSVHVSEAANTYGMKDHWVTLGGDRFRSTQPGRRVNLSVLVSYFHYLGGDTAGLAADAAGVFHPFWIDNRTGIPQVWTAPVTVKGLVFRHGAANLEDLEDISEKVTLEVASTSYDRARDVLSVGARIRNRSKEALRGPIKVRVVRLQSDVARVQIANADNGECGPGAVWDFSGLLNENTLKSDERSSAKTLIFHLSDLRPFRPGKPFKFGLVDLDAMVLGKIEKGQTSETPQR